MSNSFESVGRAAQARPAVFLDRDGVLNEEVSFITRKSQLVLIPRAAEAICMLNEAGRPVVVVTNQSAVARGLLTEEELAEIHSHLRRLLAQCGAHLDGIYYSPYHPSAEIEDYRRETDCRKPGPGLFYQAARALCIDLPESVMIGDSLRDIEAARAAGLRASFLVRTGHGKTELERLNADSVGSLPRPDRVFDNLLDAAHHILKSTPGR